MLFRSPPGATPESPPRPPKSIAPQVPANWKAGTATLKVTPQKMLWMAGYAARKKPAEGKVQDLFAGRGIAQAVHTGSDAEGMAAIDAARRSVSSGLNTRFGSDRCAVCRER